MIFFVALNSDNFTLTREFPSKLRRGGPLKNAEAVAHGTCAALSLG